MVPTILNLSRHTGLHLYTRNQARAAASMSMTWHIGIISCLVFVTFAGALTNRSPQNSTSRYRGLLTFCRGQLLSPAIGLTIFSQLNCVICSLQGCSLSFTNTRAWLWFQAELSQAPVASPGTCNNAVNVIDCLFISSLSSEIVWLAVW